MNDLELGIINSTFPWANVSVMKDGRILGKSLKGAEPSKEIDWRIKWLKDNVGGLHNMYVAELGSCEGLLTTQLSQYVRWIDAYEVRLQNILLATIRQCLSGVNNTTIHKFDVQDLGLNDTKYYDLIFHSGVLYHLQEPESHLLFLGRMASRILLDTHYSDSNREIHDDGNLAHPFSGVYHKSVWIAKSVIFELLNDGGFTKQQILNERVEKNGKRITIYAEKEST